MRLRSAAELALLAGAVVACVSDRPGTEPEPPLDGDVTVAIQDFAYDPPSLTVAAGTTILWTNADNVPHTVTADDGESFASDIFGENGTYQLVAPAAPGSYPYHCALHPFMTATLTVTAP
jgi:plastocyanin